MTYAEAIEFGMLLCMVVSTGLTCFRTCQIWKKIKNTRLE
jgi:hypothetical protein